jgi:hypothetical protein
MLLAVHDGHGPLRPRHVAAQALGQWGQGEAAPLALREDADACQGAEQAVERRWVRPGGAGEFVGAAWAVSEQVSQSEFGGDVIRLGEPVTGQQPLHLFLRRERVHPLLLPNQPTLQPLAEEGVQRGR